MCYVPVRRAIRKRFLAISRKSFCCGRFGVVVISIRKVSHDRSERALGANRNRFLFGVRDDRRGEQVGVSGFVSGVGRWRAHMVVPQSGTTIASRVGFEEWNQASNRGGFSASKCLHTQASSIRPTVLLRWNRLPRSVYCCAVRERTRTAAPRCFGAARADFLEWSPSSAFKPHSKAHSRRHSRPPPPRS